MTHRVKEPSWAEIRREIRALVEEYRARADAADLAVMLAEATQAERDLVRRILGRGPGAVSALAVLPGGRAH